MIKTYLKFILCVSILCCAVSCTDEVEVLEPDLEEIDYFEFSSVGATVSGTALKADQALSDNYIEIPYSCEYLISRIVEVEVVDLPEGLYINDDDKLSMIVSSSFTGNYQIPIYGQTEVYGEQNFSLIITSYSKQWNIDFTVDIEASDNPHNPDAGALEISNVKFTGPIFKADDANFSENFTLSFDYENGTDLSLFLLTGSDGLYAANEDDVVNFSGVKAVDGASSMSIDLGYTFFANNIDEADFSSPKESGTLNLYYAYNKEDVAEPIEISLENIDGFIWKNYTYKIKELSSSTWIDRNVGATSNVVIVPETSSGNSVIVGESGYTPNYRAFGHYFQSGRATGIPLVIGEQSPLSSYDASYADIPYFKSVSYNGGSWDDGHWTTADSSFLLELNWQDDQDTGGVNNPCPPGYRVPYRSELTAMVSDVISISGLNAVSAMMQEMNFELSGNISYGGPSVNGAADSVGQPNAVGLQGVGDGTNLGSLVEIADGYINIASCEVSGTTTAYLYYLRVRDGNTSGTASINRSTTMPIRCIKY